MDKPSSIGKVDLYTIGHSAHPLERLLGLLAPHGIAFVADVRSHPVSRFHPQYRRRALECALNAHPLERLLGLLAPHGIAFVADVRSHPTSRFHPQYRRRALERALNAHGISYVFLGDELGGRPADPACYRDGRLDYALVTELPGFRHGIERLLALARERTTALLCGEEDPSHCHRQLLIARYLRQEHPEVAILHIRGDGRLERAV